MCGTWLKNYVKIEIKVSGLIQFCLIFLLFQIYFAEECLKEQLFADKSYQSTSHLKYKYKTNELHKIPGLKVFHKNQFACLVQVKNLHQKDFKSFNSNMNCD